MLRKKKPTRKYMPRNEFRLKTEKEQMAILIMFLAKKTESINQ